MTIPAGGPTLRLADSMALQEPDSVSLGRLPYTFAVDDSGRILIADLSTNRVLIFEADGSLHAGFGREGGGPGEFERIGSVTLTHGAWLLQANRGTLLTVLDRSTGKELNRLHYMGGLSSAVTTPRHLLMGIHDEAAGHVIAVAGWDSLAASGRDVIIRPTLLALPRRYAQYRELALFNQVIIAVRGDTLAVGFGATDWIVRMGIAGGHADTIGVPRRLRRGAGSSLLPRYHDPALSFHDALSSISNLLGLWFTGDGHLVLWFQEASTADPRRKDADLIGHAYLAVLSPELSHACVETRLDAPGTARTRLAFARDTLYSIDQAADLLPGGEPAVRTLIRKYVIDLRGCDWIPTASGGLTP